MQELRVDLLAIIAFELHSETNPRKLKETANNIRLPNPYEPHLWLADDDVGQLGVMHPDGAMRTLVGLQDVSPACNALAMYNRTD